ncbi:hypothetical protein HHL16_00520 [Pseudoflavitalea sp. G-6-1-2]|uniref:hypothetical protein n=1 Tax=Pseudoflavitalea sp. G-6-1-2 TaxID=2728841 RepID=UPI001469E6F2|nr:hypothetical protein [Pseudoflavitalea sp. G-6-1-2]NML19329.1 hypothetical protein [Pseudoflavitalea sp. G-6-1-2]
MEMKQLALAALLLFGAATVQAQSKEPVPTTTYRGAPQTGFNRDNLFFGGNFGLSFGNYTLVNVSPQVGYRFNRYFAAGAGVNFIYSSVKQEYTDSRLNYRDNFGVAGLNAFGRVYPVDYLILQIQPEANYTWGKRKFSYGSSEQTLEGKIVPSLVGGAGAVIPAGRGSFIVMAQYDLLQQDRNPYGSQIFINFGYNIGF